MELPSEAGGYTLVRSDASRTGYAGVKLRRHTKGGKPLYTAVHSGRHLGSFGTAVEAAIAYAAKLASKSAAAGGKGEAKRSGPETNPSPSHNPILCRKPHPMLRPHPIPEPEPEPEPNQARLRASWPSTAARGGWSLRRPRRLRWRRRGP